MKKYTKRITTTQLITPGNLYSANDQCELLFGDGYRLCTYMVCRNSFDWIFKVGGRRYLEGLSQVGSRKEGRDLKGLSQVESSRD